MQNYAFFCKQHHKVLTKWIDAGIFVITQYRVIIIEAVSNIV